MAEPVRIELSSMVFSGYVIFLNPEDFNSEEDIASFCHKHLLSTLISHNLRYLTDQARALNFHVHDFTYEEICSRDREIYYVCDHC